MKCKISRERLEQANLWLEHIKENYEDISKLIEIYTESFLIVCKSITDYVIMDYLENNFQSIKMSERSKIIHYKKRIFDGKDKLTDDEKLILEFLEKHNNEYKEFEGIPLVAYFLTMRNVLVHSIFPHIFENQYEGSGEKQKIVSRRFQRDFQNYLLKEDGGGLLLESGFHLLLSSSGTDSFFDLKPLSTIRDDDVKKKLKQQLENDDPIKLMKEYLDHLSDFIHKFE